MAPRSGLTEAGKAAGVAVAGLAAACCVVLACGVGAWVLLGPVNYFGCGTERPENVSEADLIGTYVTQDGARLELRTDGSLTATALSAGSMDGREDLSGLGRWWLEDADSALGDINLSFTSDGGPSYFGTHLDISGSRKHPWLYWFEGDPDECHLYRFDRLV